MGLVVDTCILIDVAINDPKFGFSSAQHLTEELEKGLLVCPVTVIELAPTFRGSMKAQQEFLRAVGADFNEPWTWLDTVSAFEAWDRYVSSRRRRPPKPKRPVADLMIGAFATRFDGLITRNPSHFAPYFPGLKIQVPRFPADPPR